jgi:LAO/AO transport system kinase
MSTAELLAAFDARRVPALARAISMVENGRPGVEDLLSALHARVGRAHRIGITGPPGSGKSTLTEHVVQHYRQRRRSVAVVAVDPTSPFTGGALLGDRIRMESVALDPDVFIRSMATRGEMGGLATATREVCDVLDAFGFERILIETVGVGQSELTIAATADTSVLLLVPESGDGVQVLKAGVMEIADIYAINKADRPGADRLRNEIEVMLGIRRGNAFRHVAPHHHPVTPVPGGRGGPGGQDGRGDGGDAVRRSAGPPVRRGKGSGGEPWEPPALLLAAVRDQGVAELVDTIERHAEYVTRSGELERRRRVRLAQHTREVVERTVRQLVWDRGGGESVLRAGLERVTSGRVSPYDLADEIVASVRKEMGNGNA